MSEREKSDVSRLKNAILKNTLYFAKENKNNKVAFSEMLPNTRRRSFTGQKFPDSTLLAVEQDTPKGRQKVNITLSLANTNARNGSIHDEIEIYGNTTREFNAFYTNKGELLRASTTFWTPPDQEQQQKGVLRSNGAEFELSIFLDTEVHDVTLQEYQSVGGRTVVKTAISGEVSGGIPFNKTYLLTYEVSSNKGIYQVFYWQIRNVLHFEITKPDEVIKHVSLPLSLPQLDFEKVRSMNMQALLALPTDQFFVDLTSPE